MTHLAVDVSSKYLQWMAYLRHELYTPLNAIKGYSELLIEDSSDAEVALEEAFFLLLKQCNHSGVRIFSCINQYMGEDSLLPGIGQLNAGKLKNNAQCCTTAVQESWNLFTQVVLLQHLQPMAIELEQLLVKLVSISPSQFSDDIVKIAIAVSKLKNLIAVVLQSKEWPCDLTLQEEKQEYPPFKVTDSASLRTSLTVLSKQTDRTELGAENPTKQGYFFSVNAANKVSRATNNLPTNRLIKPVANILVVDDNSANCELLCRYIARQGHQAHPVDSGLEALEQIKTGTYDLILLDILMPEMDGYEVLEWIRCSEWRHLSVIMISSLDELDSVVKCIEMGAEDYLPKPFNPILLKARLDACLEKKRMRDQEVKYLDKLAIANSKITDLNAQLRKENGRLNAELDVSRKIQQMMLPRAKELAQIEDLDLVGFMKPADEIGGDYYDIIRQDDGVIIGIGDVTGHGLESGLLMLMIQTAVRTLVEQGCRDYKEFLDVINRTILSNAERMETSRSSTLLLIHYHAGKLKISGQHEEIVIIRKNGSIEYIDTVNLGFPMGVDNNIYDFLGKTEVKLELQDIAILYTDGITEAENSYGQFYGIDRLSQVAAQHRFNCASIIRDAVINDLTQYIGSHTVFDDITLVVIKRST